MLMTNLCSPALLGHFLLITGGCSSLLCPTRNAQRHCAIISSGELAFGRLQVMDPAANAVQQPTLSRPGCVQLSDPLFAFVFVFHERRLWYMYFPLISRRQAHSTSLCPLLPRFSCSQLPPRVCRMPLPLPPARPVTYGLLKRLRSDSVASTPAAPSLLPGSAPPSMWLGPGCGSPVRGRHLAQATWVLPGNSFVPYTWVSFHKLHTSTKYPYV